MLAHLQHPHIVPLLGFGSGEDLLFYTMPLVRGESLRERLARERPLPIDEAITLLAELADAVAYAHTHGVIHRDIKPANALLADGHAVLSDFGIARSSSHPGLTATGLSLGTVGYMAPEQMMADATVDERADIFSLAVVGYEMLTGESPTPSRLIAPSKLRPEIPAAVSDALVKALSPSPDDRFATASDFRAALRGRRGGWNARRVVITSAVVAALAILAAVALPRLRSAGTTGDAGTLIAVAPFDVIGPELQLWREGMVDLLARNLEGMGDLRAVPPSTVLHAWRGRADANAAQTVGDGLHSALVVYGSLRADGDSVHAAATLYDTRAHRKIADVERLDAVAHIDRLADSLTVALIRARPGGTRPGDLQPRFFGTRSMLALKEYLQGEQAYRRSAWDSAEAHFARAIQLDTSFALAYRRRGDATVWRGLNERATEMLFAASARNHGLASHDSALIVLDSLRISLDQHLGDEDTLMHRLLASARDLTARFPEDAEGWYLYGDVLYHLPSAVAGYPTPAAILEVFDRAIAADSGLGEAYAHAASLAMVGGDHARAARYSEALGRVAAGDAHARARANVMLWFARTGTPTPSMCRTVAETLSTPTALYEGLGYLGPWPEFIGEGPDCLRALAALPSARRAALDPNDILPAFIWQTRRASGWPMVESVSGISTSERTGFEVLDAAELVLWGVGTRDSVLERARALFADTSSALKGVRRELCLFWAVEHDSVSLRRNRDSVLARSKSQPTPFSRRWARATSRYYDGYLALARNDTAGAIRVFESMPFMDEGTEWIARMKPLPWLYAATGRYRDAYRVLGVQLEGFTGALDGVLRELQLGLVAERIGEREAAAKSYRDVIVAWRNSAPALRPLYQQALDGYRRTAGDAAARQLAPRR